VEEEVKETFSTLKKPEEKTQDFGFQRAQDFGFIRA